MPPDDSPVRAALPLPYARHDVTAEDAAAVLETLCGDWLTTGPKVEEFERAVAEHVGVEHCVAVSSGTAALHAALHALGIGPGDEVIVPALTFVATANAVAYCGGKPIFADVDPKTLLLDPASAAACITPRTRTIVAVDYAGQPCDYEALRELASRHGLALLADGCHALGAAMLDRQAGAFRRVGALADLTAFSLHPVKPITAAEGGLVTTDDARLAASMRRFRNHGIDGDHRSRAAAGAWRYRQMELGFNYRLSDLHAALGLSQLKRLDAMRAARARLAACYERMLADVPGIRLVEVRGGIDHAWHLYVVRVSRAAGCTRDDLFGRLRAAGVCANVHYGPVHLQPYYRQRFGTHEGMCPVAEAAAEEILSLPLFSRMTEADAVRVVRAVQGALEQRKCAAA